MLFPILASNVRAVFCVMATLHPFAALLPRPDLAARICELPYDVMSSDEARQAAAGNDLSFFRVSKPEIELPPETDPYSPQVYARGAANFRTLIARGALLPDSEPCFYLYRQVMGRHAQTGIVAAASCQEYLDGIIRKHELTRPDKEDDRVRHIESLNAQTGPVFLTYPAQREIDALVSREVASPPTVDFTAADGIRHTSWRIHAAKDHRLLEAAFTALPRLYIADGHHRSAAAARVFRARNGAGNSSAFLAVIFPHDQMQILPYNRAIKDLNGLSVDGFLEKLGSVVVVRPDGGPRPARKHDLSLFVEGRWLSLTFRPELTSARTGIAALDVTLLQELVLAPLLGVDDPRTSSRIHFVGGIRGTAELERLVAGGGFACAFSLHPTRIEDLMAIADAGAIMPPKSTWFEPKLRDAMFCLTLG